MPSWMLVRHSYRHGRCPYVMVCVGDVYVSVCFGWCGGCLYVTVCVGDVVGVYVRVCVGDVVGVSM